MSCRDTPYREVAFWADRELALLRERFPDWYIWYVLCYPNSVSWCSYENGESVARFNRNSPDELAAAIEAASRRKFEE